ncbi:hypothetical protein Noda2021_12440 [Candidatus Dependentiae bacterium Noda2021]|nr:hypothetical protein Noda2021_12440 [Candidatus Dependentiae bacterium Noda2021]
MVCAYRASCCFMMVLMSCGQVMATVHQPLGDHEIRDLEMFTTHNGSPGLFSYLDYTHSECGKRRLKKLLKSPTCNIEQLKQRQVLIKELADNQPLRSAIEQEIGNFARTEPHLNNFWHEPDQLNGIALKEFYYQNGSLKKYNKSPFGLELGQVLYVGNLFLPIFEHFVLHLFISEKLQDKLGFKCAMHPHGHGKHDHHNHDHHHKAPSTAARIGYQAYSAAHWGIHLMGLKGLYDHLRQKNRIIMHMQEELIAVRACLDSALNVLKIIEQNQILADGIPAYQNLKKLFNATEKAVTPELKQLLALLSTRTFKGKPSFFSRSGNILAAHRLMRETKDELYALLEPVGQLDAFLSAAYLYNEHKDTQTPYSFASYVDSNQPELAVTDFWNPFLPAPTTNSIELGVSCKPRTAVVTGPNRGGKSTAIKSVADCIVCAQTLGIAPARSMSLTPFSLIKTAMNITDDLTNGHSLFSASVARAQAIVIQTKALPADQFAFVALDELFNSTVYETGQELSHQLLSYLGNSPNSVVMAATHFPRLTELSAESNLFSNYKVEVTRSVHNEQFKLLPGVASLQSVLELMPSKDLLGLGLSIA